MKKIIASLIFVAVSFGFCNAENGKPSQYKIDETSIDAQFEQGQDITSEVSQLFVANELSATSNKPKMDSKQQTAAIVSIVQVVTGIGWFIPVHRFILGTNGNEVKIFFAYFCTGSGCGVGLLLDAIFLIIHMDETNYLDNGNIIMWKE